MTVARTGLPLPGELLPPVGPGNPGNPGNPKEGPTLPSVVPPHLVPEVMRKGAARVAAQLDMVGLPPDLRDRWLLQLVSVAQQAYGSQQGNRALVELAEKVGPGKLSDIRFIERALRAWEPSLRPVAPPLLRGAAPASGGGPFDGALGVAVNRVAELTKSANGGGAAGTDAVDLSNRLAVALMEARLQRRTQRLSKNQVILFGAVVDDAERALRKLQRPAEIQRA